MARSQELTGLFQHHESTAQRHYEICRAYFLERLTANEVAERLQLHVGSIRALVRDFARHPDLGQFFRVAPAADRPSPKRQSIRARACALRRQGHTLAEIRTQLHTEGHTVSEAYLFRVLQHEGLAAKGQRCRPGRQPGDQASPHRLFRKFVDTPGSVTITGEEIVVRLSKRAHNPLLQEARLTQRTGAVPWLGDRPVRVECP